MLSIGACAVDEPDESFYAELKPISENFVHAALQVSGFKLEELQRNGTAPEQAMKSFEAWIRKITGSCKPVFVGFNACYDWQFVNWYFVRFTGANPFGFSGLDIKSFYMGLSGKRWSETTSSQLPAEFQPDGPQTHNALDDARAQASIFAKLLRKSSE
jgi:DNA polymerase III epsilon subunit-like protein